MEVRGAAIFFICVSWFSLGLAEYVEVRVKGVTSIATTDDNFICATLDWWPADKCDYGQCPWGKAGIFNLDLSNKILHNAVKAFNPMRIRVGGSLQDQVSYGVGFGDKSCNRFKKNDSGLFGFSEACLHHKRWDELNQFFNKTKAKVTFGLNALHGKKVSSEDKSLRIGDWNAQNSRDLMEYTIAKGYQIDSYELGNELSGSGVSARIESEQYAKDMKKLKEVVTELYPDASNRPKVLGPAGFYDKEWFENFLQATGPGVVDGVTHHLYNLGPGVDPELIDKVQDPFFLSEIAQTFYDLSNTIQQFGPWLEAWVGEAGGAYNSGGKDVSHTFADGFWYLDQLGITSTYNHKVYCKQALIGGNYALLNTTTFIPNPDYYGALLWHRLMGTRVLSTMNFGSPYLRAYCHCTKNQKGVTLLLINMSNTTTFDVAVLPDYNLYRRQILTTRKYGAKGEPEREEYHLTPEGGNIQSDVVLLNGTPLKLTNASDIPEMKPKLVDPTSTISVAADSIVFVSIKNFHAPACA
ncbi:heparanase-like protein 2 [Pyrus communis]|uniref:heparanase-like protein 2 n=1 Tax=Pyrus communis TaxID=23211 RepID=UPI0035C1EA4C